MKAAWLAFLGQPWVHKKEALDQITMFAKLWSNADKNLQSAELFICLDKDVWKRKRFQKQK